MGLIRIIVATQTSRVYLLHRMVPRMRAFASSRGSEGRQRTGVADVRDNAESAVGIRDLANGSKTVETRRPMARSFD